MSDEMRRVTMVWANEQFELLADKALWWPARRTLIVADVHLGKAAAFRRGGLPVPRGTTAANLRRLDACLDATAADQLIVLGDLFHARTGVTDQLVDDLAAWRRRHAALAVRLVTGNHDRHAGPPPSHLDVESVGDELCLDALTLRHEPPCHSSNPPAATRATAISRLNNSIQPPVPASASDRAVLAGHIHPAVRLVGRARRAMKAPCFCFSPSLGLLPAFGDFTGTHVVRPHPGDQVFAVGPNALVEVGGGRRARSEGRGAKDEGRRTRGEGRRIQQ